MRRYIPALVLLTGVATSARADDLALAKQASAKADAAVKRLADLRTRGLASDMEVQTAEFQAHVAKAVVARLDYDDAEEKHREAAVKAADAILKRVEEFHKKGITAIDDVDQWRKLTAVAKIELAAVRGRQKEVIAQSEVLLDVEEKRLARVQGLYDRKAVAKGELDAQKQAVLDAKRRVRRAYGDDF